MRRSYYLLAGMIMIAAPGWMRADEKSPADSKLAALGRFEGEWVVDGKWSGGQALRARAVYEWSLGKRIMTAKTFVMNGDKEYQRYESIMAWHPEKKSLYEISFVFDGEIHEVLFDVVDKDTIHIGWKPFHEKKATPEQVNPGTVRQVLKFLDNDHFQWTVTMKAGEEWKQLIDATWVRKK